LIEPPSWILFSFSRSQRYDVTEMMYASK